MCVLAERRMRDPFKSSASCYMLRARQAGSL